jgi:hypothetical protein
MLAFIPMIIGSLVVITVAVVIVYAVRTHFGKLLPTCPGFAYMEYNPGPKFKDKSDSEVCASISGCGSIIESELTLGEMLKHDNLKNIKRNSHPSGKDLDAKINLKIMCLKAGETTKIAPNQAQSALECLYEESNKTQYSAKSYEDSINALDNFWTNLPKTGSTCELNSNGVSINMVDAFVLFHIAQFAGGA